MYHRHGTWSWLLALALRSGRTIGPLANRWDLAVTLPVFATMAVCGASLLPKPVAAQQVEFHGTPPADRTVSYWDGAFDVTFAADWRFEENGEYTVSYHYKAISSDSSVVDVSPKSYDPRNWRAAVRNEDPATIRVTPTGKGVANITIKIAPRVGNGVGAETSHTFKVTVTQTPRLTINRADEGAITGPFAVTFGWSEPVTGFAPTDVTVTGGTLSGFAGSGSSYTGTITPDSTLAPGSSITVQVSESVVANSDGVNNLQAQETFAITEAITLVDQAPPVAPTLAITRSSSGVPTTAETITFTFSAAVTGFTESDIVATGGTLSNFAASGSQGTTFTATFTPGSGDARILVPAGVAEASGGAGNLGARLDLADTQANRPPVIDRIAAQNMTMDDFALFLDVEATDPDGDSLRYRAQSSDTAVATVTPTALTDHDANSKVTVTPVAIGNAVVTLTVSDGLVESIRTFRIAVSTLPSAPAVPVLEVRGKGLAASWAAPNNGNSAIIDYDLRYRQKPASKDLPERWTELDDTTASTATTAIIDGLTNGTEYEVQVRAQNANGESPWSPTATGTPAIPTLRIAAVEKDGVFNLNLPPRVFTEIVEEVGTVEFTVTLSTASTETVTVAYATEEIPDDENLLINPSLQKVSAIAGEDYTTVTGTLTFAPGETSKTISVTILDDTVFEEQDNFFRIKLSSPFGARISAPSGARTYSDDGQVLADIQNTDRPPNVSFMAPGLNSTGSPGATVRDSQGRLVRDDPEGRLKVAEGDSGSTDLTFTITQAYPLNWDRQLGAVGLGEKASNAQINRDFEQSFPQTGLVMPMGETQIEYTVKIIGNDNENPDKIFYNVFHFLGTTITNSGDASFLVEITIVDDDGMPEAPAAPVLEARDAALAVSWTAPTDDGGLAITDYDLRYREKPASGNPAWTELDDTTASTATTATITGLTNDTEYEVQVRAQNPNGEGVWSPTATGTPVTLILRIAAVEKSGVSNLNTPRVYTDILEEVGTVDFTVTLSRTSTETVTVAYATEDIPDQDPLLDPSQQVVSAVAGEDYTAVTGTLTFAPGETSKTISVTILDDTVIEETGNYFRIKLSSPSGAPIASDAGQVLVNIYNSDQAPSAPAAPVLETRNAALAVSWTAPVDDGSSAITDYDLRYRQKPASGDPAWTELDDTTASTATTATINSLTNGTEYEVQVRAQNAIGEGPWSPTATGMPALTLSITAEETTAVSVGQDSTTFDESVGTVDFTVTLSAASAETVTVGYATQGIPDGDPIIDGNNATSAVAGEDYTAATGTLTFTPGDTSKSITVNILDDTVFEQASEMFKLVLSNPAGALIASNEGEALLIINNDDPNPAITVTAPGLVSTESPGATANDPEGRLSVVEGDSGTTDVTLTITHAMVVGWIDSFVATIRRTSNLGSATAGSDFTDFNIQNIIIEAGETETTFTLSITGDEEDEDDKTFYLTIRRAPQAGIITNSNAEDFLLEVAIVDDDGMPSAPAAPVLEARNAALAVSWTAPADNGGSAITDYDLRYREKPASGDPAWTELDDTTASTATTATITGLTSGTEYEVQVRAQNANGTGPWSPTATEMPLTLSIATVSNASVDVRRSNAYFDESVGTVGFTVTLSTASTETVTVDYATQGIPAGDPILSAQNPSAVAGEDYTAATGTLTFAPGDTSKSITVTILDDTLYEEANHTFKLVLSNPAGALIASDKGEVTLVISDDDEPPAITVTAPGLVSTGSPGATVSDPEGRLRVVEGDSSTTDITLTITQPRVIGWQDSDVASVYRETSLGGSASAGSDFTDFNRQGLTIESGETQTTFTLSIIGDEVDEDDKIFYIAIRRAPQAGIITNSNERNFLVEVTVVDDDGIPSAPAAPVLQTRNAALAVSWTAPADDGGSAITDYDLRYREKPASGDPTWTQLDDTTASTATTATITGLTNGTEYEVQVRAQNANGEGPWSPTATETPVEGDVAPAFAQGETITTQSWKVGTVVDLTLPAATGGNGTVSYELTPALPAGVTVDLSTRQVSGKPTAVATAATYTWRAKDSDSNTADTDTVALTFSLTVGKGTLATPENLVLKDGTRSKTGFTVTWDAVDNAVGYTATAAAVGDATVTGTVDTSGSTPEASFSSLTVGTTYTVTVIATGDTNYNNSAAKTLSQSTAANAAPSITGIGNQAVTYGAAALSLDVGATDSNEEDDLKYQVSSSDTAVATVSPTELTALDATSKVTVTPVGAGTATITVTVNDGTASPTTTFTVTVSRATLATPVLTLDGGDGELTPQWAAVDNAASYELQWKAATTSSWDAATGVTTVGAATSGTALTGLSNGTEYNVRVRAKAASASTTYEDSAWSPTATETPVEDDVAPAFAQGETITTQSWKVGTVVDLTLPAATGGNGTVSYELTPALPAGVTVDLSTRQVSGKPTAVAAAATYTWRAKDSDSNTANTDTVALTFSLTVGKGTLATPENLVLKDGTRNKTGFTVTWDAVDNAVGYTATAAAVGDATVTGTVDTSGATPEASFNSLTVGTTYTVTVIATGDTNYNNSAAKTLSQSTAANAAPSITGIGNQAVTYGAAALSLDVGATDSNEEDDLKYQVSSSDTAVATVSPTELTALDATSKVTVTPVGAGTATITVTVNDGTASPTTTFTVTVSRATLATPVLTLDGGDGELTPQWAAVDNAASYELQWKAATTSSWDAATGVTTVGAATSGTALTGLSNGTEYNVRVRAKAASASTTYEDSAWSPTATETPVEDDVAPAFAQGETITTQSWKVGTVVDLTLPAATGGNGTVSYELTPALPAGVTVDLSTRQVSGKPTAVAAAATYTWRAKDSDSNTADTDTVALTFSLTVGKGTLATPENLVLKDGTRNKTGFTVTWDAVDNAVGYTATAAAVGDATVTGTVDTSGAAPEASFSGLTVGTTYTVTVIATGDTNYNNSAAKTLSQSTAANAAPSITGIGNQAVTYGAAALSLDVGATDSNEEDDLKYQVSSSDTAVATVSPTALTALDATSKVTVTPVGAGTATITVTVNDGTASPTTTFTVTVSRATLATPVLTLDGGDGELTPQWAAVDNAASYELQWKAATTSSWDAATGVTTVGAATSGTALTGLSNGTEYDVRVRAKAASASTTYKDSAWSQVKQATPVEDDVAPAFAQGETITTQSWTVGTVVDLTLPAATGGNGTVSYELTPALPAGVTVDLSTRQVSGKPTAVATAATYTWRAKDSDSNTANTDTVALTFSLTVGKGTLATPENLVLKDGTRSKTGFTVTWDAVDNAVGYTATAAAVGDATVTGTVDTSGATPEASFSSLTVGTTYTVTVIATGDTNYNNSAAKTLSQSTAANAAPSITGIGNQAVTYGAAALSLDVGATDSNGEDELKYQVSSSDTAVATVSPTALTALDATSKVTVTPVGAGTATITLTVNDGTASPTTTFTVTVSRATLATPVLTLDGGDGELTPQWAAVDNAASYELQWKAATTSSWDAATGVTTVGAATSGTALTGLSNGTEYDVRVRAKAASASTTYKDSAWSQVKQATPVEDDVAPAFAQGETITTQSWKVGTVVDLTLPAATGGNGTVSYELTPALPAGVTVDLSTRQVSGKPTAVATTATYTWRAKDSDSNTANTDTVALTFSLTVGKGTLATPENLVLKDGTRNKTGFTVTWDAVDNAVGYTATAAVGDATVTGTVDTSGSTPEASFSSLAVGTTYTVKVIATGDTNYNDSAAKTLSQSTAANAVPSITGIGNQAVTYGAAALSLDVGATDSNGEDDLKYQVSSSDTAVATVSPTALTALDATSKVTVTPVGAGTATITLTVNDGTASPTTTFTVTVSRATLATPVLTLDGGDGELTPQWAAVDNAASYELQWKAATTSSWDAATGVTTVGAATSGTALTGLSNGTEYDVRVRAKAASASTTYKDSVWSQVKQATPVEDDVAPAFAQGETITTQSWKVGTVVDLTLPAATGGNGTVSYELTPALPAGVTVDLSTRQVSGKPTAVATAATYTWRAKDSDSNTADTDTVALTFSLTVGKGTLATPENLVLKDGTRNKTGFTVTWDAVDNAVGYTATAAVGDATVTGTVDTSGSTPEASFSSLAVGTTYTVKVIATGDTNYNDSAAKTLSQSTAANAAPSITGIGNQAVTYGAAALSLDVGATDSNGEDELKYQVSSSNTAVATVSPTALTALDATSKVTVTSVGAGTATITVTVNDGTASPTTTFTVTVSRATLATPVLTLDGGDGELTPQWAAVDNAASYELQWKAATTSSWDAATGVTTVGAATSGTALTGLSNGTEYDVRVRAKAASASTTYEDSVWSQVKQATPVEGDVVPAFAQGETITTQSWTVGTVVDLTLPAATGGNGTVSYELTPALPAGVTVDLSTRQVSGKPTAVATAATYTWRAKDSDSNTADTDTVALTFSLTVGKGTLATPENLVLKDGTRNKTGFTVTWDAVDNAVGYTATAAVGDATVTGTVDTSGSTPEASFSSLAVGTTYTVKVIATGDTNYNNSAAKTLSQSTAANVAPSITGIGNQVVTYGAAALSLDVGATDSNGEDELKYQVSSSNTAVATVSPTALTALDATSKVTVTSVGAGTATITVTVNDGTASPTTTFTVTVSRATLATPVLTLDGGDGELTPQWAAVDNAASYELQWKAATTSSWDAETGVTTVGAATSGTALTGLSNGTEYDVRVRAKAASASTTYEDSVWSQVKQATPVEGDVVPAFAQGETITTQSWTVGTVVDLTLPAATGGNGTVSYELTPALPAGVTVDLSTRQVSGKPTAVATAATYTWRAKDSDSNTADTDTVALTFSLTVGKGTLATPDNLVLKDTTRSKTGFTVTWDAVDNAVGYTATAAAVGDATVTGTVDTSGSTPEASFSSLTVGTTYTVTVIATGDTNYNDSAAKTMQQSTASNPTLSITAEQTTAVSVGEDFTTFDESVGTVGFTVTLSAASTETVTVGYATQGIPDGDPIIDGNNATSAVAGEDYTAATGTLTFTPGDTSKSITVNILDDTVFEQASEMFKLVLSNPAGALIASNEGEVLLIINNDDQNPAITVTAPGLVSTGSPGATASDPEGRLSVVEGDSGTTDVTLTITHAMVVGWIDSFVATIKRTSNLGSATAGSDFTDFNTQPIIIEAGETETTFTLSITGDETDEADKTFYLTIRRAPQAGIITNSNAEDFLLEVTIVDDDGMPSAPAAPVLEARNAALAVSWTAPADNGGSAITDYDLRYREKPASGDPAWTELDDTTASTATTATITGLTSGTEYEVQVRAQNANGTGPWSPTATEMPLILSIATVSNASVDVRRSNAYFDESVGTVEFTVTLSAASTETVTVGYATQGIPDGDPRINGNNATSAVAGEDYTAATGTLTFTPGDTSKSITVNILDDTVFEQASEMFKLVLSNPAGALIASNEGEVLLIINNDDQNPAITVTAPGLVSTGSPGATASDPEGRLSVVEGDSGTTDVTLTITHAMVVGWIDSLVATIKRTSNLGSATAGSDFTDFNIQPIIIEAGETETTFTLSITGDEADEADETFYLTIRRAPQAGIITNSNAEDFLLEVTIVDDDGIPSAPPAPTLTGSAGQLTANWTPPSEDGSSAITDYDLRYREKPASGDPAWTELDDTTASTATAATITGLTNGTEYEVQVRAQNANGEGPWSPTATETPVQVDVAPAFADGASIPAQTWTVGASVDVTLPAATSGNGAVSYELTPELPTGVTLDRSTLKLGGAPTAAANGATTYTWRATDSDGNTANTDTAALTFTVTVSPAPTLRYPSAPTRLTVGTTITPLAATTTRLTAPVTYAVTPDLPAGLTLSITTGEISGTPTTTNPDAVTVTVTASADDGETATADITFPPVAALPLVEEVREEVNTEVLPSVINQVAEKQVSNITGRLEVISSGLNIGNLSMEEVVTDVADYLFSHHQDIQANGFDWQQALSGHSFSFALADSSALQDNMDDNKPSSGPVSFWGSLDYSSFQDKIDLNGDTDLDGDTLSFSFGVDKEFTSDLVAGVLLSIANSEFKFTEGFTGTYEVSISTMNPYISWDASDNLNLWASFGYGQGHTDLKDTSTNETVGQSGDFTRFSAGGRFQLWESEAGTGLALKLDGTAAHFLGSDVQRTRLATELYHDFSMDSGVLNTALELGLLVSSADESVGELVGRLHWQDGTGLSTSVQSRVLLGGGDRKEWGIGGALRYTTGGGDGQGEGLVVSLEPSFGISDPQLLPNLWQVTRPNSATTTAAPTAQFNAAIAYGFPINGGLLTPYTDFSFSETTSAYGAGLRYGLPTGLDLDLKGTHKNTTTDDAENSILLELRSDL